MLKEAIEKIVSLATPQVYDIYGEKYTISRDMTRIAPHVDRPEAIAFSSLGSVVRALQTEMERSEIAKPIFVHIKSHALVEVLTTLRTDTLQRDTLYTAKPELPDLFSTWNDHENAIIALKSQFVPGDDVEYILDLLSRISSEESVSSEDNGVTQKVSATRGVALKGFEAVKGRVTLAPYRTFLEVEQPKGEFILRVKAANKENGSPAKIGIIEADGGAWKLVAKRSIADYFREQLAKEVDTGSIVVAE